MDECKFDWFNTLIKLSEMEEIEGEYDRNLKMDFPKHFAVLFSLFLGVLFAALFIYIFGHHIIIIIVITLYFLIDAIPALYLHYTYYLCNKGEHYYLEDDAILKVYDEGESRRISVDEISCIELILCPSLYKDSDLHVFSIESYNYAVVRLKSEEFFILTCLLAPRIDKELEVLRGVKFVKKKKLFCTLPSS